MSEPPTIELEALLHVAREAVAEVARGELPVLLVRARLGDLHRELELEPPTGQTLEDVAAGLDDAAWRRVMVLLALAEAIPERIRPALADGAWAPAFLQLARDLDLLTLELLAEARARREELVRSWLMRLGVAVDGETPEESVAALERVDYARLIARVDAAKARADERLAYLRRLQAAAD